MGTYDLARSIELAWFEDGDHDLKPRKSLTGLSQEDHLRSMAQMARAWAERTLSGADTRR